MQFKQKPTTLVCYICGREFGTKSLQIHLKSCQSKFQLEQSQKQKKDRRTLPQQPVHLRELLNGNLENLQVYNEQALQVHKYQVLPSCKFCGRTFNEESLKVHINACSKKSNIEPVKKMYEEQVKKPRTLACCVCGREFGLTSLKIHYPQCIEKFQIQQSKKPRQQRRKTPTFSSTEIELFENKIEWSNQEIEAFNTKAMSIFRQKGMIHCQICRRSFMPEPYQKHLRNCKQNNKNYKEPSIDQISTVQNEIKKPKVLVCHVCGRQFGLSSLTIHQKTCKEKFLNAQKIKPKQQRRPLPILPSEVLAKFSLDDSERWPIQKIQEYNKICNEIYRNQSMFQCSICKRKFIETAYLKHKSYCEKNKPANTEQNKPETAVVQQEKKIMKQKTKQIKVENVIPQTAEQLEETVVFQSLNHQSQAPIQKKTQLKQPNNITATITSEKKLIDEVEQQFQEKRSELQLAQPKNPEPILKNQSNLIEESLELHACEKCGRKFLSERLQKHVSVCKGSKIIPNFKQKNANKLRQVQDDNNYRSQRTQTKKVKQQQLAPQNYSKQLVPCSKCGRRFLQNRLAKHQQCCKGKQNGNIENQKQFKIDKSKQNTKRNTQLFEKVNEKNNEKVIEKKSYDEQIKNQPTPTHAQKESQSFQHIQLKPCSKCERKFAIDRLQVHENICKGKPKLKIDPPQKAKTIQVIKKTKENFFKMVQDIKSKKIKEQQIDKQLEDQLKTLVSTQQNHKIGGLRNKKQNQPKQLNYDNHKSIGKQIDHEKISKWKKVNITKKSPQKQFKKQGRIQSHLPKI